MTISVAQPVSTAGGLLRGYAPPGDGYDELLDAAGAVRPAWRPLVDALDGLGAGERAARWDTARRLLRRSGVTYHVYDDPRGVSRPWGLDPVPMLVPPEEWAGLEAGLEQRARLLDAVLADCYGPQRLLAGGLLPPDLVYRNPAFLRPCHGVPVPRGVRLQVYAADVGRAACGAWPASSRRCATRSAPWRRGPAAIRAWSC